MMNPSGRVVAALVLALAGGVLIGSWAGAITAFVLLSIRHHSG